jgi:hypothetical protein
MLTRITLCLMLVALCAFAQASQPLTATVARNPINAGETTVVRLTGGQLDVAGGITLDSIGTEFAHAVEIKKIDKNRFQVKGLAACECVLKFSDGKNETTVKLRVVKK